MSRSPLFRALRRAAAIAQRARAAGLSPEAYRQRLAEARHALSRRDLLRGSLGVAALAGLSFGAGGSAGCGDDDTGGGPDAAAGPDGEPSPDGGNPDANLDVTVAIIGGGMAGLHCAHRLRQAGISATVYEATDRVGGRMFTARNLFADGQVAELGGELIDTGHATMHALAEELSIQLDDIKTGVPSADAYYFNGALQSEADVIEEFTPLAERMAAAIAAAEADDDEFSRLDGMSISQWLAFEGQSGPLIGAVLSQAYTGEYGLEADEQSVFNLFYLIDSETPDPFRIFGDSDETFHTHLGSDTFTTALAGALGEGQIVTGAVLTAVASHIDGYLLTFDVDGHSVQKVAAHVVLAIPFTTLRDVNLSDVDLPPEKTEVIEQVGYGTNAKLMSGYDRRVWLTDHEQSGSCFADNGVQSTWDTSRGQPGAAGLLTNFVGGELGVAMGEGTAEERMAAVLPLLEPIYPGIGLAYTGSSAVRMHWPTAPFAKGSYACYRPGQWAFYGNEGTRVGNIHFCGEHTSLEFQGFMEGAAETGARAAAEILDDLGVAHSASLRRILASRLVLPPSLARPRQRWAAARRHRARRPSRARR